MQKMDSDKPRATILRTKRHIGILRFIFTALFSFVILHTTATPPPVITTSGEGAPFGVWEAPKPIKPLPQHVLASIAPIEPITPPEPPKPAINEAAGDCNKYRSILAQYSWNVDVAVNVCNAESHGFAGNENATDRHPSSGPLICWGSRGLFQIGCDSTSNYAGMHDPYANIAQAYAMYQTRGWSPWGYTTCRYKVACY